MKIFKDRKSAGKLLANHLKQYKGQNNVVVLGIPRGGVVVAHQVAKELKLPLDIVITRKIGHPNQPELAVGAIDPDGEVVWDQELDNGLKIGVLEELREIKRREEIYRQGRKSIDLEDKTIILVDDGIATGATITAAISYLKRHKVKNIVLATPVASKEAIVRVLAELEGCGEVVILETPEYFQAVGQFYHEVLPISDEEVIQLLS